MNKTKEQLLKDYKKSNKQRREKILLKVGSDETNYLKFLNSKSGKKPAKIKVTKEKEKVKIDYVVAFDTTGSMAGYINDVKKHVENLIPEMFSQDIDLKMKIIAFGDYCDMESAKSYGKAYQESKFTDNQQELISFVQNAKNTTGGDPDEFYELVIKKIVDETPWREESKRTVLFIGDLTPHSLGYSYPNRVQNNQIDWRKEAKKAALENISFDTLAIHGSRYPWYKELSDITKGVHIPFQSSNKTSEVFTASVYARGTAKSKASFVASYNTAVSTGDAELIGAYKSLSTLLED